MSKISLIYSPFFFWIVRCILKTFICICFNLRRTLFGRPFEKLNSEITDYATALRLLISTLIHLRLYVLMNATDVYSLTGDGQAGHPFSPVH